MHSLLAPDEESDEAGAPTATCCEVTSKAKQAMPPKVSPTSLGCATLEPGEKEAMSDAELDQFLKDHDLVHLKGITGIHWRAKKLQFALKNNNKLINPKLSEVQKKQLMELLIHTAECLATKIEDLQNPCKVDPINIPTSSPPIR